MIQRTILIIDDSEVDRAHLHQLLDPDSAGEYQVEEAASESEALTLLARVRPDCALLSASLLRPPGAPRSDALVPLLNTAGTGPFPLLLLTDSTRVLTPLRALRPGATGYLSKENLSRATLLQGIDNAIENHQLHQQIDRQRKALTSANQLLEHTNRNLSESRERLRLAIEAARMGTWDWNLTTEEVLISQEAATILGLDWQEDLSLPAGSWKEMVFSSDWPRVEAELEQARRGAETWETHCQIARPAEASRAWIELKGRFQFGPEGQPQRLLGVIRDITVERADRLEKERLHHQLTLLLDSTDEGIYGVDHQGCATFVNTSAARHLGYTPDELLGKHMHGLIHHTKIDGSPYREQQCPIFQVQRTGQGCRLDSEVFWCRDGSCFPVEYSSYPVIDQEKIVGCVVRFSDITERKRIESSLKESEERLQQALQTVRGAAFDYNLGARQRYYSEGIFALTGYSTTEALGDYNWWQSLIVEDDRRGIADFYQYELFQHDYYKIEYRIQHKSDRVLHVSESGRIFRDAMNQVIRILGVVLDITAQKEYEQEINTLNARLRRSIAESHHRIKNNLQILSAIAELKKASVDDLAGVQGLGDIQQHIRTLATLHDMLTAETHSLEERDTVSLRAAMERLVALIETTSGGRQVSLVAQDTPILLRQVSPFLLLLNELISNALKYCKKRVEVGLELQGNQVVLEVRDDGSGFAEDFDPQTSGNTGMELIESLVRWDLRGDVTYTNRSQGGARVQVTFLLDR